MNRTALQNYFSIENFVEIVTDSTKDIEKYGVEELMQNKLLFAGLLHRLEILGEISKNLSKGFKLNFVGIPWNDIAKTRDILTHHYHRVDPAIVKKILIEQVPILLNILPQLQTLAFNNLDEEDKKDVEIKL